MKAYIKIEKIIKFFGFKIVKRKFHQHNEPTSIKNIDINKIVISNKVSFGKKGFEYFIGYNDAKKLDLYVYFSQKSLHIDKGFDETKFVFFDKRQRIIRKV